MQIESHTIDRREQGRRLAVYLVFLIYWLMIFEGALRKWVFPAGQEIIYFIKDPIVLFSYLVAFRYELWPRSNFLALLTGALGVVYLLLGAFQITLSHLNPLIALYGWRNYFLFIPIAFLIGNTFKGADLAKLLRQILLITIP